MKETRTFSSGGAGSSWIMAAGALLFCTLARTNLDSFGTVPWVMAAIGLVLMMTAMSLFARGDGRADRLASPILFGLLVIWLWEMLVVGLHVPFVILPPPSAIARAIWRSVAILRIDFEQTYLHSVVAGYAIGCGSGFLLALAIDRSPFLQRGLTPLGNLISAMPIIGIAPIMVMWFGFGWPSKAAVVVLMTVFPMLVNTRAGLASTDAMERDLMRTYAAGYWQTFVASAFAGRHADDLQCFEAQLDTCPHWCGRRRVLRHPDQRHGLQDLDRGRAHEPGCGLGHHHRGPPSPGRRASR